MTGSNRAYEQCTNLHVPSWVYRIYIPFLPYALDYNLAITHHILRSSKAIPGKHELYLKMALTKRSCYAVIP